MKSGAGQRKDKKLFVRFSCYLIVKVYGEIFFNILLFTFLLIETTFEKVNVFQSERCKQHSLKSCRKSVFITSCNYVYFFTCSVWHLRKVILKDWFH